jgi:hypothetical protein
MLVRRDWEGELPWERCCARGWLGRRKGLARSRHVRSSDGKLLRRWCSEGETVDHTGTGEAGSRPEEGIGLVAGRAMRLLGKQALRIEVEEGKGCVVVGTGRARLEEDTVTRGEGTGNPAEEGMGLESPRSWVARVAGSNSTC